MTGKSTGEAAAKPAEPSQSLPEAAAAAAPQPAALPPSLPRGEPDPGGAPSGGQEAAQPPIPASDPAAVTAAPALGPAVNEPGAAGPALPPSGLEPALEPGAAGPALPPSGLEPALEPGAPVSRPLAPLVPAVSFQAAAPQAGQSPWVTGAAASGDALAQASVARGMVNLLTGLLLLATVALAVSAALPILVRAALPEVSEPARRGVARIMRAKGYAVGPPSQEPPPSSVGHGLGLSSRRSAAADDSEDSVMHRIGIVRAEIAVRDQPDAEGQVLGQIKAGSVVLIAKELGDWVQVVSKDSQGGVIAGWAQRQHVAAP